MKSKLLLIFVAAAAFTYAYAGQSEEEMKPYPEAEDGFVRMVFHLWVAKTSSAARLLAFHGSVKAGVDGGLGPYCGVECRLRAEEST